MPCLSDNQTASFIRTGMDGTTELVIHPLAGPQSVLAPPSGGKFASHPAMNSSGVIGVYGERADGESVLWVADQNRSWEGCEATGFGPLGPTINEEGEIACRRSLAPNSEVGISVRESYRRVLSAGENLEFHGIPVINNLGALAIRQNKGGEQGIVVSIPSGESYWLSWLGVSEVGPFIGINNFLQIAFRATREDGTSFLGWTDRYRGLICLLSSGDIWESFRGILIDDFGRCLFYGTPVGCELGVYFGHDPSEHFIFGIGHDLGQGKIVDFALNPVSINCLGQFAFRATFEDGSQGIYRAVPV